MGKKTITKEELTEISNRITMTLVSELSDDEKNINPGDFVCVLAIMHRTLFANIEAKSGIEKAREETGFLVELVEMTLDSGAWDEENKCIK
jgi:hypothetical protein